MMKKQGLRGPAKPAGSLMPARMPAKPSKMAKNKAKGKGSC
jgi:hypothetical protein